MSIVRTLRYYYYDFMDRHFPDKRTYVGNFDVCADDNWGDPCEYAELDHENKIAICKAESRLANKGLITTCPYRKLMKNN